MIHHYKDVLLVIILAILWFIFAYGNRFDNWKRTSLRTVIALAVGWIMIFWFAYAVTRIDLKLATTMEEKLRISSGDGAKHTFALLFGWAFAAVPVGIMWVVHRIIKWFKNRLPPKTG